MTEKKESGKIVDKKRTRKNLKKIKELESTNMLTQDSGGAYNTPAMYPNPNIGNP
ncbi:MAG: hypothetical protein K2X77_19895 [Candidatus Obscuribacterales bacterium]|jgi:hypothetical protein|nr:hypothetical protein [Candidatus Obscuribacterales bacterium]